MDKASASGAGDSRFESWADQIVWKGGSVLVGYSDCAYAPSRFHVFIVEIKGKVRTRTHTSLLAYICAQVLPTSASSSRNHAISDLKKINMLSGACGMSDGMLPTEAKPSMSKCAESAIV